MKRFFELRTRVPLCMVAALLLMSGLQACSLERAPIAQAAVVPATTDPQPSAEPVANPAAQPVARPSGTPAPLRLADGGSVTPTGAARHPAVREFIDDMVERHDFDRGQLLALFSQVEFRDDIIARMTRPAERVLAWHEYRDIFLDRQRIDGGVAFWREHADTLARAERVYGVPAEIIVAIIGVETRYGRITGRDAVMDALTTLAFEFPRRADFFRSELEHYLLLTREEGIDPLGLQGSYAGAMGIAQFMPSSYRAYAIDFNGDGRRNLWTNPVDAIGSVASYLAEHGWRRGEPITAEVLTEGQGFQTLTGGGLDRPQRPLADWRSRGVRPEQPGIDDSLPANLLEFEARWGTLYRLTFNNFYVITRYNRSPLYAMAVYELARSIRSEYPG